MTTSKPDTTIVDGTPTSRRARWGAALRAVLIHPRLPWILTLLAVVLTLPSIGTGLIGDDYHHKLVMKNSGSVVRLIDSPLDLFRFFGGDPVRNRILMDFGALPWWTYDQVKGGFWRPIASLTHWMDYVLWPNRPALMHVQSILWYALVVGVVAVWYRRMMGIGVAAGLAAVLYAVDHTHGLPVGFLANRSDLPAVLFGVLCLIAHDRWRRETWQPGAVLAPVLLAMSLLSKEAGLATCAYLAAYEAFVDRGTWPARVRSLISYALVVVLWRACWTYLGYGVSELGLYIDPLTQTTRFIAALPERMLVLLLGLWGMPPAEAVLYLGPRGKMFLLAGAVAFLAMVIVLLLPLLRRDRLARFWATGMILSILPGCATFPSGRLLMFAGLGAMGLLAQWLSGAGDVSTVNPSRLWRVFSRTMAGILVAVHLAISPLLLLALTAWPAGPKSMRDQLFLTQPLDAGINRQDLVIINPPEVFGMLESFLAWAAEDAPRPHRLRALVSGQFSPVEVYRPDEQTLVVRPETGFLAGMLDTLFRGEWRPFKPGEEVVLQGMTVRITELTPNGRPAEAAFRFDVPLEDASLRWMCWEDGHFLPFVPPPVGHRATLGSSQYRAADTGL